MMFVAWFDRITIGLLIGIAAVIVAAFWKARKQRSKAMGKDHGKSKVG